MTSKRLMTRHWDTSFQATAKRKSEKVYKRLLTRERGKYCLDSRQYFEGSLEVSPLFWSQLPEYTTGNGTVHTHTDTQTKMSSDRRPIFTNDLIHSMTYVSPLPAQGGGGRCWEDGETVYRMSSDRLTSDSCVIVGLFTVWISSLSFVWFSFSRHPCPCETVEITWDEMSRPSSHHHRVTAVVLNLFLYGCSELSECSSVSTVCLLPFCYSPANKSGFVPLWTHTVDEVWDVHSRTVLSDHLLLLHHV